MKQAGHLNSFDFMSILPAIILSILICIALADTWRLDEDPSIASMLMFGVQYSVLGVLVIVFLSDEWGKQEKERKSQSPAVCDQCCRHIPVKVDPFDPAARDRSVCLRLSFLKSNQIQTDTVPF